VNTGARKGKKNWRRGITIAGAAIVLHILSVGPTARFTDMNHLNPEFPPTSRQNAAMTVYLPLIVVAAQSKSLENAFRRYVDLWNPTDAKSSN